MLVEHTFVTTRDAVDALTTCGEVLRQAGFSVTQETSDRIEARKGLEKPRRARSVNELPQHFSLNYDRGRVNIAISIETVRKPGKVHRDLLVSIANLVEAVLARGTPLDQARGSWASVQFVIEEDLEKRRTHRHVLIFVLLFIVTGLIAMAVFLAR